MSNSLRHMLFDRSGNFAIITALVIPCLLGIAGTAIDVSEALMAREELANMADSAALAASSALGAKKMTVDQAKTLALQFVSGHMATIGLTTADYKAGVDIQTTALAGQRFKYDVSVSVQSAVKTSFSSIMGYNKIAISDVSKSTSSTANQKAVSMYFVLDRSGSMQASVDGSIKSTGACDYYYMNAAQTAMYVQTNHKPCNYQRIELLKSGVAGVLSAFETQDPTHFYVRTGADAYNTGPMAEQVLNWGTSGVGTYVNALTPSGGTSSTAAFKAGVDGLLAVTENDAHLKKNGLTPEKYLVFMTDGENNASSDNTATLTQCTRAKNAGVTVYTVGFLLTSATAKAFLSSCASKTSTYYDATDGGKLTQAFADIAKMTAGSSPLLTN